jgi:hypothetical protein
MVIKERYNWPKSLHKAEGVMLLEVVILLGFVVMVGVATSTLHGIIMTSYRETNNRMHALSYAENVLTGALTDTPYRVSDEFFKSTVIKTQGTPFLPVHKPFTVITATVTWQERAQENNVMLTRLVVDTQVRA